MSNGYSAGLAGAGQDLSQINRATPVRPPSLEQRLDYLQRALERLMKLRAHLGSIAERASVDPRPSNGVQAGAPPSQDLSGRFGDTIGYIHANLDELDQLSGRIESALFEPEKATAEARRA